VKWDVGLWDGWSRVADDENRGWPAASG